MTSPNYDLWERMKKYEEKFKAQELFCIKYNAPIYVPADWYCFKCKKNIFDKISLKEAGEKLITGCPYCNVSFLD